MILRRIIEHTTGIVAALAAIFFIFGQQLEAKLFPANSFSHVVWVELLPNGGRAFQFVAYRSRACVWNGSRWYLERDDVLEYVPSAGPLETLPVNRPLGDNLSPRNYVPGPGRYWLVVRYDCGFPWESVAELGPINIP